MTRPVLILGAGATLPADLAALGGWPGPVMAVNRAGAFYAGRLDHWATLHPDRLGAFLDERTARDLPFEGLTWSLDEADGVRIDRVVTDMELSGSSGLFAVRIALHRLGHDRVVLAGVPLDNERHFYDGVRRTGPGFVGYRLAWRRAARDEFDGRVRSVSGWTADLLGRPDPAWLEG